MRQPRPPLLVLLLGVLCLGAGEARAQVREPALKAAFVYNFLLFTTWPAEALAETDQLRLCVDARHALASALGELHGKPVGERRVSVQHWDRDAEPAGCHVAVVGAAGPGAEPALARALAGGGLLTVSDGGTVGSNGAAIVLVREEARVRFDVDGGRVAQARLALSSRLLRLARRVL
ncbi:YfiR family protein [Luteimonas sp. RD2P54]|uniref:YfiR family protein n=1 Tax=Luteimonas endophytica TaxID=3042023 RepID=A0ABT6JB16_9GAMM|nr:YfiR family protein [Luteimonas endophytica]MDH5823954.1 YfiR family protein [Luteimonas endophytica]